MTVKKIEFASFSIPIRTPRLAAELQKLDTDANGTVNLEDIRLPNGVEDRKIQSILLKRAVSAAFVNAGSIPKDQHQQSLVENFIDLYAEVQDFRRAVSKWHQWGTVETADGKKSLAFNYATYCRNNPSQLAMGHVDVDGGLSSFASRLHRVVHGFGPRGHVVNNIFRTSRQSCDYDGIDYLTGMTYDPLQIPEDLRDSVRQTVQNYLTGANWLFQFDATYCGSHRGSGDNSISSYRRIDIERLERLDEGPANVHYYGKKMPPCAAGGL